MPKPTTNLTAEKARFRFPDPRGDLDSAAWPIWRRTAAFTFLADALNAEGTWWSHVDQVREAEDRKTTALELSARYTKGKRREIISGLLLRAAGEPTRETAYLRLLNYGTQARTVAEDPPSGRPARYGFDPQGFFDVIALGAMLIARRGASKCFECGTLLPLESGDYCRRHDGISRPGAREATEAHERAIKRFFEQVRAA